MFKDSSLAFSEPVFCALEYDSVKLELRKELLAF